MTQLELLLPFAMPPQEMARDLLRELKMPALATLLARASLTEHQLSDGFSRALPHENWLARQFGLPAQSSHATSPALAASAMQSFNLPAEAGVWFILQPVHLHVARDHLVLTDLRQLMLAEQDARTLFDIAYSLFEESGKTLRYGDAQTWFLRADDWHALQTSTPDAACGHNIDIWMPQGDSAREWRRLQNEIQMHWHAHPVNDQREALGLKPVNSVWLWAGTASGTAGTSTKFEETFTFSDARLPFAAVASRQIAVASAAELINARAQHGLLMLDHLTEAALAADWSEWLLRFQVMEAQWFAPLLDAIRNGQLDRLTLTISHNTAHTSLVTSKSSLRKFWRKPSLARLAP